MQMHGADSIRYQDAAVERMEFELVNKCVVSILLISSYVRKLYQSALFSTFERLQIYSRSAHIPPVGPLLASTPVPFSYRLDR